jgi:hypothetical protein
MRAIEIGGQIDKNGLIKIDTPLSVSNKRVKVIILLPEDDEIDDESWLQSIDSNSAFDFLNHKEEDIYSISDGTPFKDEI